MPWTPESLKLPIATPGQMNPFNQALTSGLDTYQNMMKAAYTPAQTQANINAKNAYAQNYGRQMLSTILGNPLAVSSMSDDQFKNLLNQFSTQGNLSGNGSSYNPVGQTESKGLGGIWDNLMEKVGLKNPSPMSNPSSSPSSSAGSVDMGANDKASPEEVQDIANNGNSAYQNQSQPNVPQGTPSNGQSLRDAYIAKNFPGSPQGIEAQAKIETAVGSAKAENDLWKERVDQTGKVIDDSQKSISAIESMQNIYPKLNWAEKGFIGGHGPAISSEAQLFDKFAKTQATTNLRAMQTGHITNTDFAIGDQLQPGRWMNEQGFEDLANYNKALGYRSKQKQKFYRDAKGRTTVEDADSIWSSFMDSHPIFDSETHKLDMKNAKISPFSVSNKVSLPITNTEGRMPPKDNVWMKRPDGVEVPVHRNNIGVAKNKYKYVMVD
jgi:hypothetical protein